MPDCDDLPASVIVPPGCRPVRVPAFGQPPVDRPGEVVVDWERSGWSQFRVPVPAAVPFKMTVLFQGFVFQASKNRGWLTNPASVTFFP